MAKRGEIGDKEIQELYTALEPLRDVQFEVLKIPRDILQAFEPSQIGTIVGTLMDACIPELGVLMVGNANLAALGLRKHEGVLGDREGYPDYRHEPTGKRLELKLLYVDPAEDVMKVTATRREPSARLTQKVTIKNVDRASDVLLVLAYQLRPLKQEPFFYSPTVIDLGIFSMIECIEARDHRLREGGGMWFGDYETPTILSKIGKAKRALGRVVDSSTYGRKESEGHDFNEDTNFGKLKRIPFKPLQEFLKANNANYARSGTYPAEWDIPVAGAAGEEFVEGTLPPVLEDDE